MKRIYLVILSLLVLFSAAKACRFTVREIGFADFGTDEYTLYFFKDENSTADQVESFKKISYAAFLDANVISKIVDVQQSADPVISRYKKGSPEKQQLLLVSQLSNVLEMEIDRSTDNFREEVWTLLEQILTSPTREIVLDNIIRDYAVVLVVEGADEDANAAAQKMVSEAIDEIKVMMANMPKPVEIPPQVFIVKNNDIDSERILLWSLGLDDVRDSLPAITVLYGRGRQMGRLLPAGLIKSNIVRNLLAFVGADCECGLDRSWILGRMIPTRWESDKQREIIEFHHFDAENPLIKAEMSQILSISPNKARSQSNSELSTNGIYSYTEKEIELVNSPSGDEPKEQDAALISPLKLSILIIASLLLAMVAFGAILVFKARQRKV